MDTKADQIWDVIVIGAGPSGMMAAGRAAEMGAKVLLLEKNDVLGKKLLITGGGRCNITNAEMDTRKLLSKFKGNDKFLFSAFSQFAVEEALDFFHIKKLETKVEAEKRAFPVSEKAIDVRDTLAEYLKANKVTILSNAEVKGFKKDGSKIVSVILKNKSEIKAKSFILGTGGKSRPETGSTGDGFIWLKELGHNVIEPSASLVPITIKDAWVKKLSGLTLKAVKITLLQNNVKQDSKKGRILFTHFGISGPTILNMSHDIGELLKYGDVEISLDILPSFDPGQLNLKLQEIFKSDSNKKIKNCFGTFIPSGIVPKAIELANIDPDKFAHSVTREERLRLVEALKNIPLSVSGLLGTDKAIVTSGGVDLKEVDFKTMESKLFPNLYLVGDILNIDRPSGGYSLQLCWTTGFVAGSAAASSL
ncbi:MAG: NAD(P)/FAD-dependent oxidoreductase [Patescibacteria group bacterium]